MKLFYQIELLLLLIIQLCCQCVGKRIEQLRCSARDPPDQKIEDFQEGVRGTKDLNLEHRRCSEGLNPCGVFSTKLAPDTVKVFRCHFVAPKYLDHP